MARPILFGLLCLSLCASRLPLSAQMDTLLHDSFDNNFNQWPVYSGEKGKTFFSEGAMHHTIYQRKNTYRLMLHPVKMTNPDTFMVEVRLKVDRVPEVGIVFDFYRGRKEKHFCYQSVSCTKGGVYIFGYSSFNNVFSGVWYVKDTSFFQPEMHFRVEYMRTAPKKATYFYSVNGKLVRTCKVRSKHWLGWKEMGIVVRGAGEVSVDDFLLVAREGEGGGQ